MASQIIDLNAELNAFAQPLIESGLYVDTAEVLHAAMDALRLSQINEDAVNAALLKLAEEGEASGEAEGDIFAIIRSKYGFRTRLRE